MKPHERLAQALDGRRLDLGLTWEETAERAKISAQSLRAIRGGDHRPKPLTARNLEKALEWEPGTVLAVYEGRIGPEEAREAERERPDDDDKPITRGEFRRIAEAFEYAEELSDTARKQLRALGIDPARWQKSRRGTR